MALTLTFKRQGRHPDAESLVTFSGMAECEGEKLTVELQVGFQDLKVKYGLIRRRHFFVGCFGSRVEIRVPGGRVKSYSRFAATEVAHDEGRGTEETTARELAPSLKLSESVEISAGKLSKSKTSSRSSNTKYTALEKKIADTLLDDYSGVRWTISSFRDESAIRDNILDTFELRSAWDRQDSRHGMVDVDNDVLFFDSNGQRIEQSWLMSYRAWRCGIRMDGLATSQRTFGFSA